MTRAGKSPGKPGLDERHAREGGRPCWPKTTRLHTLTMGPRLRGDDGWQPGARIFATAAFAAPTFATARSDSV
jgi:hypothetical protein